VDGIFNYLLKKGVLDQNKEVELHKIKFKRKKNFIYLEMNMERSEKKLYRVTDIYLKIVKK